MLLATRCPFCETVFRIQPTQLAVRRGLVRCGHCQEAFDATGSLYEVPEGREFAAAVPVSAEIAASLTAPPEPQSAIHPALNSELEAQTSAPSQADLQADLQREFLPEIEPGPEAEIRHETQREIRPELAPEPEPQAHAEPEPEAVAPAQEAAPAKHGEALNFSNRAWDPWAPPTQGHLDPRLHYNGDHLPQASIAPGATAGVTPNVESRVIVDDDDEPTLTAPLREEAPRETVAPVEPLAPLAPTAPIETVTPAEPVAPVTPVVPNASAEPVEVPAPAPATSAPPPQSAIHAAPAAHAASVTPSPEAAEPFPPATRWTRVEPGLGAVAAAAAAGPIEPTMSRSEAPQAHLDDSEPTLTRNADHAAAAEPLHRRAPQAAPRQAAPEPAPIPAFSAIESEEGHQPFAVTREAPARARGQSRVGWRILGAIVTILLLALLIVQIAWWQRETVMVYWPNSQPLYQKACAQLGCRVLPPRDIDGLLVEPSDLRQVDNEPHHLELKVPLRNRFNVALAYPAIELSLLDRQNNIVVRRVLWPQDYVTPGTRVEAGLPAHTTQTMIVRLDTGDVVASNFRIEIFYP